MMSFRIVIVLNPPPFLIISQTIDDSDILLSYDHQLISGLPNKANVIPGDPEHPGILISTQIVTRTTKRI
jgi:hypothetical protein